MADGQAGLVNRKSLDNEQVEPKSQNRIDATAICIGE